MASSNKNKFILGLVFIIAAFACIAGVFYSMGQKTSTNQKDVAEMQAKIEALTKEKENAKNASPVTTAKGQIKLENLLKKAEGIYSESEKDRTEGFLWFDRQGQSFIVTLGALNGLEIGNELTVYDSYNRKVDTVKVELPFDSIAFVKPTRKSPEAFNENYYRVVKVE